MKKRILVVLCVLAIMLQPVAGLEWDGNAEGVTTPSDLVTPSPTKTPEPPITETPAATETPAFTATPSPTATAKPTSIATPAPTDPPPMPPMMSSCSACGTYDDFLSQATWVIQGNTHVLQCVHGINQESSRHYYVANVSGSHYTADANMHYTVCDQCGLVCESDVHQVNCDHTTVCVVCGAEGITSDNLIHQWSETYDYDETRQWHTCQGCGAVKDVYEHGASCLQPDVCVICGATGVVIPENCILHGGYKKEHNDTECWANCDWCGKEIWRSKHKAYCEAPDTCLYCDENNVTISTVIHDWWAGDCEFQYDDTKHWGVCGCGEILRENEHWTTCDLLMTCCTCGAAGVKISKVVHDLPDAAEHDEEAHWWVCQECGDKVDMAEHVPSANNPGKCAICGGAIALPTIEPTKEPAGTDEPVTTPTEKPVATTEPTTAPTAEPVTTEAPSAKPTAEPATTEEPSVEPTAGPATTEEPAVEPTAEPATTEEPSEEPTTEPTTTDKPTVEPTTKPTTTDKPAMEPTAEPATTDEPTVTATPDSRPTETMIPDPVETEVPAHEHVYDVTFVSNGNGTHSKACLTDDCDETIIEECTLMTTDLGLMTCTACIRCGYAVYTAKVGFATMAEGENVPAVTTRVKNASIALVDEDAAEIVPTDMAIVVHEITFEVSAKLSEEIQGTVEKVFTATLVVNGEIVQPVGKVELRIPVAEETMETLEGKVLMLLKEDGTLMEIPFEIINGEIVILTDELGVFLLMAPEEA